VVADEGSEAAAYVIVSVVGNLWWTLEDCGDRDPAGARVGALLQALLARGGPLSSDDVLFWRNDIL
jgi:hypothetical protein